MTSFKVAFNLNAKEGIAQLKERFSYLSKNTTDPVKVESVLDEARVFDEMTESVIQVEGLLNKAIDWVDRNRDSVVKETREIGLSIAVSAEKGERCEKGAVRDNGTTLFFPIHLVDEVLLEVKRALEMRLKTAKDEVFGEALGDDKEVKKRYQRTEPLWLPVLKGMFEEVGKEGVVVSGPAPVTGAGGSVVQPSPVTVSPFVAAPESAGMRRLVTVQYALIECMPKVLRELAEPGAQRTYERLVEAFPPEMYAKCPAGKCANGVCESDLAACRRCKVIVPWLAEQRVDKDKSKVLVKNADCRLFHDPAYGPTALFKVNISDLGAAAREMVTLEDLDLASLINGLRFGSVYLDVFGAAEWEALRGDAGALRKVQNLRNGFAGHVPGMDLSEEDKREVLEGLIKFLDEPLVKKRAPSCLAVRDELGRLLTDDLWLLTHDMKRLEELHRKDHEAQVAEHEKTRAVVSEDGERTRKRFDDLAVEIRSLKIRQEEEQERRRKEELIAKYPDLSNAPHTSVSDSASFVPRDGLVDKVVAWGSQRPLPKAPTLVLHGAQGMGKSVVASVAAKKLKATGEFSSVRYLSAKTKADLRNSLLALAKEANLAGVSDITDDDVLRTLLLKYLGDHARAVGKPYLLVVDDAHGYATTKAEDVADAAKVREVVLKLSLGGRGDGEGPAGLVLATAWSASVFSAEAPIERVEVGSFTLDESLHVLGKLHPAGVGSVGHTKIVTDLGFHPLAVAQAGHVLAVKLKSGADGVDKFALEVAELVKEGRSKDDKVGGHLFVRATFSLAWGVAVALSEREESESAMRLLGVIAALDSARGVEEQIVLRWYQAKLGCCVSSEARARVRMEEDVVKVLEWFRHSLRLWEVAEGTAGVLEGLEGDGACAVARVLSSLGKELRGHYADYKKAEVVLGRGLKMRQAVLPAGHPDIATSFNNLALVLESQGKYTEAEEMYREALKMRQAALPAGHPDIATSLNNLADVLNSQGKHKEAEEMNREALKMRQAALPASHPDIAMSFNNLAGVYESQGKHKEAEEMNREALKIWQAALPADHPDIATSLNNLALVLDSQGKYTEAEEMHREALKMCQAALPAGHPDIATSLNNLANVLKCQGKHKEAEEMHREALKMHQATLPAGHPDIASSLSNLARVFKCQGKHKEAEEMHREALKMRRAALPDRHPGIAQSLNNLALVLNSQGKHTEAEEMHREALEMHQTALPAGHPDIARSLSNLAVTLCHLRRFPEAIALYEQALAIYQTALPPNHPDTLSAIESLAAARIDLSNLPASTRRPLTHKPKTTTPPTTTTPTPTLSQSERDQLERDLIEQDTKTTSKSKKKK